MELWDGLKALLNFVIVPLGIAVWWAFKKHIVRVDELEKRTIAAERAIAVMESQMRDIKQDIDEIKQGINKLVDRLCK